jgi:hypothetical protein
MGVNKRASLCIAVLRKNRRYGEAEIIETILSRNKTLFDELANAAILLGSLGYEKEHHELTIILNDMIDDLDCL